MNSAILRVSYIDGSETKYVRITSIGGNEYTFSMPAGDVTVSASFSDGISYVDENGIGQTLSGSNDDILTGLGNGSILNSGWYVTQEDKTISDKRIDINGDVKLILCDGVELSVPLGITLTGNNKLTIYGQTKGNGTLTINGAGGGNAGIGGGENGSCGTLIINGGVINATGGSSHGVGAGIGGGYSGGGGNITINGGTVTATGGGTDCYGAAGIGGGDHGSGGNITINGGVVTATGKYGGAGIGGGENGEGGTITINGGTVTANGNTSGDMFGAGIGGGDNKSGNVTINGGRITANNGIGGGKNAGGTIKLGWTQMSDFIFSDSYRGNVSFSDHFLLDGTETPATADNIAGKKIVPTALTAYTVAFNKNGGEGTMADMAFFSGKAQALTKNTFTREDYDFAGWNTKQNGEGVHYTDGETVNNLAYTDGASVTLYAQWSHKTYKVDVTTGANMTKTAGNESQTVNGGDAMTDLVYTADKGYYFPENYSIVAVNGITVARNSYTQITVSGTPTADAQITLTAPTPKTKPGAPTAPRAENCTTAANNDGKLTGVTAEMEYKKSDAGAWRDGTGSAITGLASGTYYVRYKETDTRLASESLELTISTAQSSGSGSGGGGGTGGGGGSTPTPEPTDPTPTTTPEPMPTSDPDPAEDVNPSADPTEGKTPQGEAKVTEESGVKTTEQKNTDGSTTIIVEDTNSNTVTTTVEEENGTKNIQTITEDPLTGEKTETGRTEQADGSYIQKTVTTLENGQTTETTESKTKNEDGSVTTTEGTKAADGTSTFLEKTEQTTGDFEQTFIVQDETGKTVGSEVSSKTTDPETKAITEKKEVRDAYGNAEQTVISKEASGTVTGVSFKDTDSSGKNTESSFDAGEKNTLILSEIKTNGTSIEIPAYIEGVDGEAYPVTGIGKDALKGQKVSEITIPETVNKIDTGALKDCGITEINITGSVEKGMLGKNALKGNGTGKKGKGLTISVDSKKDAKKLRNQLKRAGAPKAVIRISK
ncbi:MAG: InlB B-repeat-containing protein [Lachnospiraceae bacterium]|nr:InlB B-repeat-containing protein [Lachnospiraceae bacterium]